MPNINDVFPSKYLKAHELQGREPVVTIARVEMETMGWPKETLPVVYFKNKAKGLKLNRTMGTVLAAIADSADTDKWTGVVVQLYATTTRNPQTNQPTPVIRIKAPVRQAVAAPRLMPPPAAKATPPIARQATGTEGFEDDRIPF